MQTDPESVDEPDPGVETTETSEGVNWRHALAAAGFALIPAFGAYMAVSIAANNPTGIVFLIALPVFGYLLYQRPTKKAMAGGMSFWLAIEVFLAPFVFLIYTFVFASQETSTTAGQAGAAIGGFFLVIVAFVVGVPVGIVLYIISRRLDVDGD